jgi:hypothetical protein
MGGQSSNDRQSSEISIDRPQNVCWIQSVPISPPVQATRNDLATEFWNMCDAAHGT